MLARGLLGGRTYTVGVITTDSFGRFSIPVMLGAVNALGAGQISVFMCDTRDDPDRERQYLDMLLNRQVDGLIVAGRRIEPRPSIGTGLDVPVVYAMTQSLDSDQPAILPDDVGGGRIAAEHLIALGRRRFGHITGPERFLCARKRARGFCDAVVESGAEFSPNDVLYGEWSEQWGRQAASVLLRSPSGVDAIFCGSDQIARGVAESLRRIGCRVPDDMCLEDVGRVAAEHLLSAINGEPTHGVHTVPCRLVVRRSTVASGPGASGQEASRQGASGQKASG
jgi:LacI family transcriptional regulator